MKRKLTGQEKAVTHVTQAKVTSRGGLRFKTEQQQSSSPKKGSATPKKQKTYHEDGIREPEHDNEPGQHDFGAHADGPPKRKTKVSK